MFGYRIQECRVEITRIYRFLGICLLFFVNLNDYCNGAAARVQLKHNTSHPKNLYYIQSNEGVIAHLRELATLSDIMDIYGRTAYALPFASHHYPDVFRVDICSVFELPSNIRCLNMSTHAIISKYKCYDFGIHNKPYDLNIRDHESNFIRTMNIEYEQIECLVGGFNYSIGHYDTARLNKRPMGIRTFPLQIEYLQHLPLLETVMFSYHATITLKNHRNLRNSAWNNYLVVHWRRGDQLSTRCNSSIVDRGHLDTSVNCDSVLNFVNSVHRNVQKYLPKSLSRNIPIYVSTNEAAKENLQILKDNRFVLFSDLQDELYKANAMSKNSLNDFIFELMLMCHSTYFMAWGDSSIHRFVAGYRQYQGKSNSTYINDDNLGYYIYM